MPVSWVFYVYANPNGPEVTYAENACFSRGSEFGIERTLLGTAESLDIFGISNVGQGQDPFSGDVTWTFQFNANLESSPLIASVVEQDDLKKVSVNFCVLFGLHYGDDNAIFSYREIAIGMSLSLRNSIAEDNAFAVNPAQITIVKDISLEYNIHAKLCGSNPPTVFRQGDEVALCVCTTSYPATEVAGIQSLSFIAADDASTYQTAIVAGTVMNSQLTVMGSCTTWGWEHCCQVNVLLLSKFYIGTAAGSSGSSRQVRVQGVGDLVIYRGGGRGRHLLLETSRQQVFMIDSQRDRHQEESQTSHGDDRQDNRWIFMTTLDSRHSSPKAEQVHRRFEEIVQLERSSSSRSAGRNDNGVTSLFFWHCVVVVTATATIAFRSLNNRNCRLACLVSGLRTTT